MWIVALVLAGLLIYRIATRNLSYWRNKNVVHDTPWPLFGHHFPVLSGMKTDIEVYVEQYKKYGTERFFGYYRGPTPVLIVRDPDLIKHILNLDFMNFHARGFGGKPDTEPVTLNMVFADGDYWHLLRQRMPSAFSNTKVRNLFPIMWNCAQDLVKLVEEISEQTTIVDAYPLLKRYIMQFIGAGIYGINMETISDEKSIFLRIDGQIFVKSKLQMILLALRELFPELTIMQNINIFKKDIFDNIFKITQKIHEQRNYKPCGRNDFMDLLLELESMGKIKGKSIELKNSDGTPTDVELDMDLKCIAAQVFIFFAAGYETSSISSSFALHMLAFHPEIQSRVQDEIDSVLAKYQGIMSYEAICEMSLLENCFKEAMRIFPPGGELSRVCKERYTIPGTKLTIDPGVKIIIPVQGLHMDGKYYEDPTEFRPERFSPEATAARHKYVYLPFGEGPRKCIGLRMGMLQSLVGLAAILQRFTVVPAPTAKRYHRVKRSAFIVQCVEGGLPLVFKPRS